MRIARALAVMAVMLAAFGRTQGISAQAPGTITDLGTLGGSSTVPIGINDLGDVVGSSTLAGNVISHAFLWSGGALHDLGALPGHAYSQARDVNNRRQVVGLSYASIFQFANSHAFLWQDGVMVDLNTPATAAAGWVLAAAMAINDAGQIVGYGFRNGFTQRAFLLDNGVVTDLGTLGGQTAVAAAINASGQIGGMAAGSDGVFHAVTWTNGAITDLGGNAGSGFNLVSGINDSGDAAGSFASAAGAIPMSWDASGIPVVLPALDPGASAYAINNIRQIVGAGTDGAVARRAVLWQDGVVIDIETLISSDVHLTAANAINNASQVLGQLASGRGVLIQLPISASAVGAVIESLVTDTAMAASLLAKINGASASTASECNALRAAANEVRAQSGKKIPADVAAELLETIGTALSACP